MGDSASKTNCFVYRKPGDGKYVKEIDFVSAWTQNGIKEQHPDAIVPEDMNKWGGGKYICPVYTYTDNPGQAITDLKVISFFAFEDATPPGFKRIEQDLNEGSGGCYVYLCYSKNGTQKITDISFFHKHLSDVGENEVPGWKILKDGNWVVDLNEGAGGLYSNIIYKTA